MRRATGREQKGSFSRDFHLDAPGGGFVEEKRALPLGALVRRRCRCGQTGGDELGLRDSHIFDAQAEVVQARSVLLEPGVQWVTGYEGLDELEMGIAEVEVGEADGALVHDLTAHHREPEPVSPNLERFLGGRDDDGKVIEALVRAAGIG